MAWKLDGIGHTARTSRANRGSASDASDGVLLSPAQEMNVLLLRARKFRALSTLFTLDIANYEGAIEALVEPCGVSLDCPVAKGTTRAAAADAQSWVRNVGNVSGLYAEHVKLFGGRDPRTQMPQIAASGGLYAEDGPQAADEILQILYADNRFAPRQDCPCPSYIANELGFMGHLLEEAAEGRPGAIEAARDFIVTHLYTWGIIFSAATHARSSHPVTRFAGLMLEHMLFCETNHARSYDLSYRALRDTPS